MVLSDCLTVLSRCLTVLDRCLTVLGRCLTVLGCCLTVLSRCLMVLGRCLTMLGRCLTVLDRCLTVLGRCGKTPQAKKARGGFVVRGTTMGYRNWGLGWAVSVVAEFSRGCPRPWLSPPATMG